MTAGKAGETGLIKPVCFSTESISAGMNSNFNLTSSELNESWLLADEAIEAFSRLLPILACGEESAVHVFSHAANQILPVTKGVRSEEHLTAQTLQNIAKDELQHEAWLAAWRSKLPDTLEPKIKRQARHFFSGLASESTALHFVRIAALDSAVCLILAALMRDRAMLSEVSEIKNTFEKILRDEARHVRISRDYARALGATTEQIRAEWQAVRGSLVSLLEAVEPEFAMLGADPEKLFRKLKQPYELSTEAAHVRQASMSIFHPPAGR
jgi:rubrerythrin